MSTRSPTEIKARCRPILNRKDLVDLVESSASPTAAFQVIKMHTDDENLAKAGRWLAILRRDHTAEYRDLIS